MEATPGIDFEGIVLRKGQRVPKGYDVVRLTAADFRSDGRPVSPIAASAGVAETYRIGDRVAHRNLRKTGDLYLTMPRL